MIATKSHTHCLAALAAHIQSQPKSVLSVLYVERVGNEKCPTAPLLYNKDWCKLTGDRNSDYE